MCERKTWTAQQDKILRQLYEERGIKKWSSIANIMESSYHIEGRNGKQCRQRYHNHLKDGIIKQKWTREEEQLLVQLHSQHGNRWAYISKLIKGRTQNCVKNMLYSKLRKSVRQLNRFSYLYYRKTLKQIKISFINRLIEFTEAAYKKPQNERTSVQTTAIYLKNEILKQDACEVHELDEAEKQKIKSLVEQIHTFKRDNQKYYRGNILAKSKRQKLKTKDSNFSLGEDEIKQEDLPSEPIRQLKRSTRKRLLGVTSIKVQSMKQQVVEEVCQKIIQQNLTMASISREHTASRQHTTCATPNQTVPLRNKVSVMRGDSFQSNLENLLVDACLEKPIQIDNYIQNLTPTPVHHGYNTLDWSLASNGWKFSFCE